MATKKSGPLGTLVGKTGGYVTYYRMGQLVTRAIGVVNQWSDKQKAVQMGTALVTGLLGSMGDFIKIGFKNTPKPNNWNYYVKATSVNKLGAIAGVFPDLYIDFEKVVLAEGLIPPPQNPTVRLIDDQVVFHWDADLSAEGADKSDQIMCLLFYPELNTSMIESSGAKRTVEGEILILTSFTESEVIETYLCFVSSDRQRVSNSVYTGRLIRVKN